MTARFRLLDHTTADRVLAAFDRAGLAFVAEPCGIRGLSVVVTGTPSQIAAAKAIREGKQPTTTE